MRASTLFLTAVLAGCHPSATVENTMPVANLQSYRTVALRVQSTAFASQGLAVSLEAAVLGKLHQKCGFESVGRPGGTPADVILDLNIVQTGRGGGGWIANENTATVDTLLVLTDGPSGDVMGTARIRGKSSGMIVNGGSPEAEAIDVVAKTVADLLAKSGCSGPRVAKVEPPPVDHGTPPGPTGDGSGSGTGDTSATAPDTSHKDEAEALNETGKEKLRGADLPGALADFQRANSLMPDARFVFNICLTYGSQAKWDQAIGACKQARTMNPDARLAEKIDRRIDALQKHQ